LVGLIVFGIEQHLASYPISKLEDYPLPAKHVCLFNIFATAFHMWNASPSSVR